MWSSTTLAYMAGILDGEGTISVRRHANSRGVVAIETVASVSNTDERMIVWLHNHFGGRRDFREQRSSENAKPLYRVSWTSAQVEAFLPAVRPYLVTKAAQADAFMAMRALMGKGARITAENQAQRDELFDEIRSLNRRGKVA